MKPQPEKTTFNQIEEGRTIYMGKPKIPVGKSHVSHHSIWEASENMGCDLQRCNFFDSFYSVQLIWATSSREIFPKKMFFRENPWGWGCDLGIRCRGSFYRHANFSSFTFTHKISTWVQGSYKKLQPFFKDFSRTKLDFQGPPARNLISQIVQKCTFPVYSNKTKA